MELRDQYTGMQLNLDHVVQWFKIIHPSRCFQLQAPVNITSEVYLQDTESKVPETVGGRAIISCPDPPTEDPGSTLIMAFQGTRPRLNLG